MCGSEKRRTLACRGNDQRPKKRKIITGPRRGWEEEKEKTLGLVRVLEKEFV